MKVNSLQVKYKTRAIKQFIAAWWSILLMSAIIVAAVSTFLSLQGWDTGTSFIVPLIVMGLLDIFLYFVLDQYWQSAHHQSPAFKGTITSEGSSPITPLAPPVFIQFFTSKILKAKG